MKKEYKKRKEIDRKDRYHNVSEENKQRLKEQKKSYQKANNQHKKVLSFFLYII